MSLEHTLAEIGLDHNKGRVYLALLELGQGTAQQIGAHIGIPRTTAHEILQGLLSRGLVGLTVKGRSRVYLAESPKKLKNALMHTEKNIERILPELELLRNTGGIRPRVRFYEGCEGVKTVFEDTLTVSNKVLYGILSMEDLYEVLGKNFLDDYVSRRVGAGIKLDVIRSQVKEIEETWPTSKREKRELRYAPGYLIFPMTMYMYDKKVAVIGTKREEFGMIIESVELYQTMKNFFDVVWDLSKHTKVAA